MAHFVTIAEMREHMLRLDATRHTFGERITDVDTEIRQYIKYLRVKETTRIIYSAKSPQRSIRAYIVSFLMKIMERANCSWATAASTLYIYDRFLDNHCVSRKQIHLVALASFVIAGKVEERDTNTPRVKQLTRYLPRQSDYNPRLYNDIEYYIIRYLNWNVIVPTPYTFLECFMLYALDGTSEIGQSFTDENLNVETSKALLLETSQDIGHKIRDYGFEVLLRILQAEPRDMYAPSCVAASVLQYSRRRYGFNFWTERLYSITGCSHSQISDCLAEYIDLLVPNDFLTGPLHQPHYVVNRKNGLVQSIIYTYNTRSKSTPKFPRIARKCSPSDALAQPEIL